MKHCEIHEQKEITDKLREECGVFGIYDFSGENVASTIYYGALRSAASRTGELRYCGERYEGAEGQSTLAQGNGTGQRGI